MAAACILASVVPALANTVSSTPNSVQAFASPPASAALMDSPSSLAMAPRIEVFAPSFGFEDEPAVVEAATAPQALSEPSSAGLLFFGAGLIGLCYLFDALVRSRTARRR